MHTDLKDGGHFFEIVNIGVPREPIEFMCEALKVGHRKNLLKPIGSDLREAVKI